MKIVVKDSDRLRIFLMQKGFSQRNFSTSIGMSENYLNQIINKKKNPSPSAAKRIAEHLELTFEDLFVIEREEQ